MGIAKPTGGYAEQMLDPGGWPEADEDTFYDRAHEYTTVLRQVTDVLETCQHQQAEIFDGGIWSGGAAAAANGELGMNIGELVKLQNGLATVITWQRYVAGSIVEAKSGISDNVEGANQRINLIANDPSLDADERTAAINVLLSATYGANASVVAGTAEQILASKAWKPPNNALKDLLDQKIPPQVTLPDAPPVEERPRPNPAQPTPVNPAPVIPGQPPQSAPVVPPPGVAPPPATPGASPSPGQPAPPPGSTPGGPGSTVPGGAPPTQPGPGAPGAPATPAAPATPLGPAAPAAPSSPAASTPSQGGTGKGMAPASAAAAPPSSGTRPEDAPAMAPGGAAGMPPTPMASGASGGAGAGRGARSAPPVDKKPTAKAGPSTRPAAAGRTTARPAPAARHEATTDDNEPADVVVAPPIPVSAARAERDAIAEAATADAVRRGGQDRLQLARRIAAALNAPRTGGMADLGFFWVTGLTTDGEIVVANSYGLAYIPDGVQLPERVHMATADEAIPVPERARWATYPVMAVQGWADQHNTKLRAVIGTEEQLANSDAGAPKVLLKPDDIPASGDMIGRSRLDVVDPEAAERLAATPDPRLVSLLPPAAADATSAADKRPAPEEVVDPQAAAQLSTSLAAGPVDVNDFLARLPDSPTDAGPPADRRPMLWFDVVKPMASKAAGREVAHLRAFHAYAAHAQEVVLTEAHTAGDLVAQRDAVADWLYWKHLTGLLDAALAGAS